MTKIKISIFTTKWGHQSIGVAAYETLQKDNNFQAKLNNIKVDKLSELSYMPTYKLFPKLFKLSFKVSGYNKASEIITKYLHNRYKKELEDLIKTDKPKFVINTYFGFNKTLEILSEKYGFTYINIVADPKSIHKLSLTQVGYNFVFDNKARANCIKEGVDKQKIIVSGWFVQNKFYKPMPIRKINDRLTILIVGGSAGNYSVLKCLPAFVNSSKNIHLIFIAGESKSLYKAVTAFSEMFTSEKLQITTLKFTNSLNEQIQLSDLVVGKAGPNLLFETVAAVKPFLAVSHISGQEDGNLEIIKQYKLGFVEEQPIKAIKLLRKLISKPDLLTRKVSSIKKLATHNLKSGEVLKDFIGKYPEIKN